MNKILVNPFETESENRLITIGSIITVLFSYVAFLLYSRMDGLLDMHITDTIALHQPLLDNLINIATCSIFLYILGLYINKKTRFVDILAASIVARIPMYPLLLLNINGFLNNASKVVVENSTPEAISQIPPSALATILVFALLAIGALIWYMILLYKGFKISTNSKGSKPVALFIIMILIIEIVSKAFINILNY